MTEQELIDARRQRFHIAANPVRTIEDAREFMNQVGFCLMYPLRHPFAAPLPTFIGAYAGTDQGLPYAQIAFADPRATPATELMVRLLRERAAFESNIFDEGPLLISAQLFPYFYALVGDKTPKTPPKLTGTRKVSPLALELYKTIAKNGASTKAELQGEFSSISDAGLDRALSELWSILKTTRVDYSPERGASWDLTSKWAPEAARQGALMSAPEALSAIVSRYLVAVVAAEDKEIEDFVGHFASRSRVAETLKVLVNAREVLSLPAVSAGAKRLLQLAETAPLPIGKPALVTRRASRPQRVSGPAARSRHHG
ncbi:MAG: hypothetical protein ABI383_08805 [Acidobacteriaceae bacterium]